MRRNMGMTDLQTWGPFLGSAIIALVTLFVFTRNRSLSLIEKQLDELYGVLAPHLYKNELNTSPKRFFALIQTGTEWQKVRDALRYRSHLASDGLLAILREYDNFLSESKFDTAPPTNGKETEDFAEKLVLQAKKDYEELRSQYRQWQRWLLVIRLPDP